MKTRETSARTVFRPRAAYGLCAEPSSDTGKTAGLSDTAAAVKAAAVVVSALASMSRPTSVAA